MSLQPIIQNMISNIESINFYILALSIVISLSILGLVFFLINLKKPKAVPTDTSIDTLTAITSHDIKAIAGDDVMTTQLDLARAYIEMDKLSLAKKILENVIEHGTPAQQEEANELLTPL